MQVGGYNSLGRLGPWYERPEYRPPQENAQEAAPEAGQNARGDRLTLSVKNGAAKSAVALPTGKVNLAGARELTSATAHLIGHLAPWATDAEPHRGLQARLMAPVYA